MVSISLLGELLMSNRNTSLPPTFWMAFIARVRRKLKSGREQPTPSDVTQKATRDFSSVVAKKDPHELLIRFSAARHIERVQPRLYRGDIVRRGVGLDSHMC